MSEIAWLAGVIEGEGSYALSTWQRSEGQAPKIGVQVKLYNTDAGIIQKAVAILESSGITYHVGERDQKPMLKPGGEGHYASPKSMLTITVSRLASVEKLIKLLEPWTFGEKRHRLALIRLYVERRVQKIAQAGGNFRAVSIDDEDREIVAQFAKLHRRKDASTTGCETPQGEGTV